MMVTCGNHSDEKVGFMIIIDFSYYTHGLVNIRITIAIHCHLPRFLESVVLPCFRYASSGDRQCMITIGQSKLINFFCKWVKSVWIVHVDKPHYAAIGPESTQCCKPDPAPLWHICEDLTFCKNDKYYFQSHIKIVLRCKTKLLFNRI